MNYVLGISIEKICLLWSNVAASLQRALLVDALLEPSWLDKFSHHVKVGFIEGADRVIYHKGQYTHASRLLSDMKALNVFLLNIFNIPYFMYKCKKNLNPPVFCDIFIHRIKTKHTVRNENYIQETLCPTNFSQYYISYHGSYLWDKVR